MQPTENPTVEPTSSPTDSPTSSPTSQPTIRATMLPTLSPTFASTPNNRAMRVINPVALFNGIEFEDPESYQSKALAWLESSNLDPFNDDELVQRYALATIYYATNGVVTSFTNMSLGEGVVFPWNNETNWLSDESECTWARMTCNETTGFISGIDFVSTNCVLISMNDHEAHLLIYVLSS